ncbi:MAG TPA: hypothetical protein VLY03_04310 [Bacteroidota bacterium]|nr:hypothetical protein [Bacteroidota bacterium]
MKHSFIVLSLTLLVYGFVSAQSDQPYRVVFDLTAKDSLEQKAVLRWIREITNENPKAELEVVMYGKGFELVMPDRSAFPDEVRDAIKIPNVSFKVCRIAMKSNKIQPDQLFPGVQTVPDGIFEIMSKQRDQWGYIKVTH